MFNAFLWKTKGIYTKEILQSIPGLYELITLIQTKGIIAPCDFVVYRNFGFLDHTKVKKSFTEKMTKKAPGDIVNFYGLMSTTFEKTRGVVQPLRRKISAVILIPKGTRFICPNLWVGEGEILFLPGQLKKVEPTDKSFLLGTWEYDSFI